MKYLVIEIAPDGTKVPSAFEHSTYDAACAHQEMSELIFPEYAYLVYTAEEWARECEEYIH